MNTLKIQIKPYYQNNPFNLKDDQIHCLSTNKDEEEIQLLLKQMNLSNYIVFLQLDMENYTYGYLHTSSNKEYDLFNKEVTYEELIENIDKIRSGESIDKIWYEIYNYYKSQNEWKEKLFEDLEGLRYSNLPNQIKKANIDKL